MYIGSADSRHKPVLIASIIEKLPEVTGVWVDCTFGAGGYSEALLEAGADKIIGIDRDPTVIRNSREIKMRYGSKLELCEAEFSSLGDIVKKFNLKKVSGVVFDIGVSSMQIDDPGRGFSFQKDGPLDMRMSQKGITAADIVNGATQEQLADIIYHYGEERHARTIAQAILKERDKQPILSTEHLSSVVNRVFRRLSFKGKTRINNATRTFQALRIAVNNELQELNAGLIAAEQVLAEGAPLVVVSFHSLEDRLIKHFIKSRSRQNSGQSRYLPDRSVSPPVFRELFFKVVRPNRDEIIGNFRARSAKLRVAVKLSTNIQEYRKPKIEFPHINFTTGFQ